MKKSLVLAMAMALGVSATAFAANPFSDLPAGHWAYASVAKLATAGVIDGYPDGTFKGDKTMTRYEMAQIVAKALAKGAINSDDKLIGEFADELDNLGVRVSKLEKQADNVKITGNFRLHYANTKIKNNYDDDRTEYKGNFRSRLFFTGEIDDNWKYVGMLQNDQVIAQNGMDDNKTGSSVTKFQRAYLEGKFGDNLTITGGRFGTFIADGNVYDDRVDAIKAEIGKNIKFTAEYGKMANKDVVCNCKEHMDDMESLADKYYRLGLGGKFGNFSLETNYVKAQSVKAMDMGYTDDKIWTIGADYTAGAFNAGLTYLKGDNEVIEKRDYSQNGWVAKLGYGEAKSDKPGSFGIYTKYYDQGASTVISHTMSGAYDYFGAQGFKGYMVGANCAIFKNMVAALEYYDLKGKEDNEDKARTIWTELMVTF
ncbi:MAG: S-layer homology domain-containing protein [Acidaminococcaceae bacterium]|nr:S-layer homology domain-containing protein [Acidaminococcaceae bacterium]MCI2110024.1 S-layer homology domain-containing protein [Acidaminococcaceae bacterium]